MIRMIHLMLIDQCYQYRRNFQKILKIVSHIEIKKLEGKNLKLRKNLNLKCYKNIEIIKIK